MKRIIILFFTILTVFSAYSQTSFEDAKRCFDAGDYTCAIKKFTELSKSTGGTNTDIERLLKKAKNCDECLKIADSEFTKKNYAAAKVEYDKILTYNPNDPHAKSRLEKCNLALNPPPAATPPKDNQAPAQKPPTTLSVSKDSLTFSASGGSSGQIKVYTNASNYSITLLPSWCKVQKYDSYFIVTCSENKTAQSRSDFFRVSAGDKTQIINVNQAGIPAPEITLSASKYQLTFPASGGSSGQVIVYSNASSYSVTLVPSWCEVQTYKGYFIVTCNENKTYESRSDWFRIAAGDKTIRIYVEQPGMTSSRTVYTGDSYYSKSSYQRKNGCFNCPKGNISAWGLTFGYIQADYSNKILDGIQIGIKLEPLFRYGLGLNFGLNYEYYNNYKEFLVKTNTTNYIENNIEDHKLNFNAGLEYRLNFSEWFNPYIYGGIGFDYNLATNVTTLTNEVADDESYKSYELYDPYTSRNSNYRLLKYLDLGVGLRISHLQFTVSKGTLLNTVDNDKKTVFSITYMF